MNFTTIFDKLTEKGRILLLDIKQNAIVECKNGVHSEKLADIPMMSLKYDVM